jgi:hypothetical protein
MAGVVEDVRLVAIAGHTYRLRAQPITAHPSRTLAKQQQQLHQQDWQLEEELQILTLEDEEVDDSLITQSGDGFVTQLGVDAQVCADTLQ